MIQPEPNFCRNCINFVERRDIEGFAACVRNHRPRIACDDFKPKSNSPSFAVTYGGFCLYCENLVVLDGFTVCVRNHRPRIACQDFRDSFLSLRKESSLKRVRVSRVISTI